MAKRKRAKRSFRKTRAVGKFLWKHKKKSAIIGGLAGAGAIGFATGVSSTLGAFNYNPYQRKHNKSMNKLFNERLNQEFARNFADSNHGIRNP